MGRQALSRGKMGDTLVKLFNDLRRVEKVGLRELSRRSGITLTRLGNILERGAVLTVDETDALCNALGVRLLPVVAAAEWVVYGESPEGLDEADLEAVEGLYRLVLDSKNVETLAHLPTARHTKTPDASTQVIQLGSPHSTDLTALPKLA